MTGVGQCPGQCDLTELVGCEHIKGSMPADEAGREAARQAFYAALTQNVEHQEQE